MRERGEGGKCVCERAGGRGRRSKGVKASACVRVVFVCVCVCVLRTVAGNTNVSVWQWVCVQVGGYGSVGVWKRGEVGKGAHV